MLANTEKTGTTAKRVPVFLCPARTKVNGFFIRDTSGHTGLFLILFE
jgi:hypothetical protein